MTQEKTDFTDVGLDWFDCTVESYFTEYETLMLFDSVLLISLQYMRH